MKRLQIVLLLLPPLLLAIAIGLTVRRYCSTTNYLLSRYAHDVAFDDTVQAHLNRKRPNGNKITFEATWFSGGDSSYRMVYFVDTKGKVCTVRDVYDWAQQNSHFSLLTGPKKQALQTALRQLPPNSLPKQRGNLLFLTFYGPNGWETRLYDRNNLPHEVRQIYKISNAPLEPAE